MRVHIISNSLRINSGFANVARYIGKGLIKLGHRVNMTGMQTLYIPDYSFGIEQLPLIFTPLNEEMQLGQNMIASNPDVVLCVFQGDKDFNYMTRTFSRTVFYPPVEGKNIPRGMADDLKWLMDNNGMVVAQCNYGLEEMKKSGVVGAKCIYHGYNDKIFKPSKPAAFCYLQTEVGKAGTDPVLLHRLGCFDCKYDNNGIDRNENGIGDKCRWYRQEVIRIEKYIDFGNGKGSGWAYRDIVLSDLYKESQGRFVYLFVGANIGVRKRIERLLKAYAVLLVHNRQIADRTILHLHTDPIKTNEQSPGIDLHKIVLDLGLQNNVLFSYGQYISSGWSEEAMNILYNIADCSVTASSSEGFCLPVLESMACGVPVIAPACSSFIELIGDNDNKGSSNDTKGSNNDNRGILIPIEDPNWQMIENYSYRALVDEYKLGQAMEKIYKDDKLREKLGENAARWAKNYTWDNIVIEWNTLLEDMVKNR